MTCEAHEHHWIDISTMARRCWVCALCRDTTDVDPEQTPEEQQADRPHEAEDAAADRQLMLLCIAASAITSVCIFTFALMLMGKL